MFGVTRGASETRSPMERDDTRYEAFGLMTISTLGVHLVPVLYAYPNWVTGDAGIAIRSFGNRRCERERGSGMCRGDWFVGSKSVLMRERRQRGECDHDNRSPDEDCEGPGTN